MPSNREIVAAAFAAWQSGSRHVSDIFADTMRWEIVGNCDAAGQYPNAKAFQDEVLAPFAARFSKTAPFLPTNVRGIYADDSQDTVVVIWDGRGTTTAGTSYENTYAWVFKFANGKVVEGTAFFDSIAFNELWRSVQV